MDPRKHALPLALGVPTDLRTGSLARAGNPLVIPQLYATLLQPGPDKLIVKMSEDLLVGIPRKEGAPPLAMVVDKRVDDGHQTIPPRDVERTFSSTVKSIDILEHGATRAIQGNRVTG